MRRGRAADALAISLFVISCLVGFPLYRWWAQDKPIEPPQFRMSAESRISAPQAGWPREPPIPGLDLSALKVRTEHYLADLDLEIVQFEQVFWEPRDTESLRAWLAAAPEVRGSDILEVGTGTGLVAIACAQAGAASVLATDINPYAFSNAAYNIDLLKLQSQITCRLVPANQPGPFEVVEADRQFDLIISNPPWENAQVNEPAAAALYDPGFSLLDALLAQSAERLKPGGKMLLAYGAQAAIRRIQQQAPSYGWQVEIADSRELSELPEVFVPGVLLILSQN